MALDLPPTVVWPLVEGSIRLRLEGLLDAVQDEDVPWFIPDLTLVEIEIASGAAPTVVIRGLKTASTMEVDLATPLAAGQTVRARTVPLGAGAGTPFSPVVVVEPLSANNAHLSRPRPTWLVHPDQTRVIVDGCPPGHEVEVRQDQGTTTVSLGREVANAHGVASVTLTTSISPDPSHPITARAVRSGLPPGWDTLHPSMPQVFSPPTPQIDPVFAGQRQVIVRDLAPGSTVELIELGDSGVLLRTYESHGGVSGVCRVSVVPALEGHTYLATSTAPASANSTPMVVAAAVLCVGEPYEHANSDIPWPRIRSPLNHGDTAIRLERWIPGIDAEIWIWSGVAAFDRQHPPPRAALDVGDEPTSVLGPRPIGASGILSLPFELTAPLGAALPTDQGVDATWVQVVQVVRGAERRSQSVRVEPLWWWRVSSIPVPVVLEPVLPCAMAVRVGNVIPGADVYVYRDGQFAGHAVAGYGGSVQVDIFPVEGGHELAATQGVGGSGPEDPFGAGSAVTVPPVVALEPPGRILEPVLDDDRHVWVVGMSPGSQVRVFEADGEPLGEGVAAETIARVQLWRPIPASAVLAAQTRRCLPATTTASVVSVQAPVGPADVAVHENDFGFDDPIMLVTVANPEGLPMHGRVFRPEPAPPAGTPVVFFVHGDTLDFGRYAVSADDPCNVLLPIGAVDNVYLGYDIACRNLARLGMIAVSLRAATVTVVDTTTGNTPLPDYLEAAILHVVGSPQSIDGALSPDAFVGSSIGLVGQSVGGDAVLITAARSSLPIRSVVAIAPASHGPTKLVPPPRVNLPVLMVYGSQDYFHADWFATNPDLDSHLWLPLLDGQAVFLYVHGATHETFNSVWSSRQILGYTFTNAEPSASGGESIENEQLLSVFVALQMLTTLSYRWDLQPLLLGRMMPEIAERVPVSVDLRLRAGPRNLLLDSFEGPNVAFNALGGPKSTSGLLATRGSMDSLVYRNTGVALLLEFGGVSEYTTQWPPTSPVTGPPDALILRAANVPAVAGEDFAAAGQDMHLTLSDGSQSATVRLSAIVPLRPIPEFLTTPAQEDAVSDPMDKTGLWAPALIHLPVDAFLSASGMRLAVSNLMEAVFRPGGIWEQGAVYVDDIHLRDGR